MNYWKLILFLFFALILESYFTTLPLVMDMLLLYYVFSKDDTVILISAFTTGILLDIVTLRTIGLTSSFLILLLFLIVLYQRKFEVTTWPYVAAASFLGASAYLLVFGYQTVFAASLFNSILTTGVFLGAMVFIKSKEAREL